MVKRSNDMPVEIKEKMRDGKGSVKLTHIFKQSELTGKSRFFAKLTIEPGSSIGLHEHSGEEEIFYILEGKGVVNDNGTMTEVQAGDAVLTGGGGTHSVENTGTKTLEIMAVILVY